MICVKRLTIARTPKRGEAPCRRVAPGLAARIEEDAAGRDRERCRVNSEARRGRASLAQLDMEPGYKRVAKAIERQIVGGQLKPGELLPTEGDLAELMGVHRSTVREGIRSLENAGLVRRGAGKRLEISTPELSAISSVVARALRLKQISFFELWEMQTELEPFAARLAAERLSDELAQALRDNVAGLRANLDDDEYVVRSDTEFHNLIAEATQNAALSLSAAPVGALLFSATVNLYAKVPQARHRLLAAHEAILEAILAKDAETAGIWMAKHIRDFRRGYDLAGIDIHAPLTLDPRALEG